jgi:hypothetical protein
MFGELKHAKHARIILAIRVNKWMFLPHAEIISHSLMQSKPEDLKRYDTATSKF